MDILKSIKDAKKSIRRLKKTDPYLFPEYVSLQHARDELAKAKEKLEAAKARWKKVGN